MRDNMKKQVCGVSYGKRRNGKNPRNGKTK